MRPVGGVSGGWLQAQPEAEVRERGGKAIVMAGGTDLSMGNLMHDQAQPIVGDNATEIDEDRDRRGGRIAEAIPAPG